MGHLPELAIILGIALIVFGPERLPEVAGNVGKVVREMRQAMNDVFNPQDYEIPDDFSSYYYESLARAGESAPVAESGDVTEVWPGVAGGEAAEMDAPEDARDDPLAAGSSHTDRDTAGGAHSVSRSTDDPLP